MPSLAVAIRRLHDTGRSARWLLIQFVPFGGLYLLYLYVQPSSGEANAYGPPPGAYENGSVSTQGSPPTSPAQHCCARADNWTTFRSGSTSVAQRIGDHASQAEGRRFESGLPLQTPQIYEEALAHTGASACLLP